jgi:hypothetical protein
MSASKVRAIGLGAFLGIFLAAIVLPESISQASSYLTLLVFFVGLTLIGLRLRRVAASA